MSVEFLITCYNFQILCAYYFVFLYYTIYQLVCCNLLCQMSSTSQAAQHRIFFWSAYLCTPETKSVAVVLEICNLFGWNDDYFVQDLSPNDFLSMYTIDMSLPTCITTTRVSPPLKIEIIVLWISSFLLGRSGCKDYVYKRCHNKWQFCLLCMMTLWYHAHYFLHNSG